MAKDLTKDMTKGSIVRVLIQFSIPLILSGLMQQLYNWADALIVGNIEGESALAAVGATTVITNLFIMAITGFSSGISILSARLWGSGNAGEQKKILSSFTVVLGIIFIILSMIGMLFINGVLTLLKTPEDIFDIAKGYLQIILFGIPFIAIYNVYAAVLRGIGDSKAPFYAVLVSSVSNVILDIIFVGVFFWKAEGAAVATVLSQILMTMFIICYSVKRYEILRFRFEKSLVNTDILKSGCSLSLPITVQSVVSSAGNLILQNFMNGFGTLTVAAITTAYRVDSVIMLPVINLGTGIATFVAQNTGAGAHKRARKCLFVGIGMVEVVCICLTAVVLLFGGDIIEMFGVTENSVIIGREFFGAIAWFYIVYGAAMAMRGYIEGVGDVLFSGFAGILSLGIRIGLSYTLLPFLWNMAIAYAEALSWCFLLLLYVIRFLVKQVGGKRSLQNF